MSTNLQSTMDDTKDALLDLLMTMRRVEKFGLLSDAGPLMKSGSNYESLRRAMDKVNESMAKLEKEAVAVNTEHWKKQGGERKLTDPMIQYQHKNDPKGITYKQFEKDPLPDWAVNVRPYNPKGEHHDQASY